MGALDVRAQPRSQVIAAGLAPLWSAGDVYELRMPKTRYKTISGYFDDAFKLADAAAQYSGQVPGVYLTLNPVNPVLLARAHNRVQRYADATTNDRDIARRRFIPLDFDPVRPANVSSDELEHDAALRRGVACCKWLVERGIPRDAILYGDSGNGAHVLVRVDLPNDDEAEDLVKRFIQAVSLKFSDDEVSVDLSTFNASRIWKVPGTLACKGDDVVDRPHREARWIQLPETIAPAVRASVHAIADLAPPTEAASARPIRSAFDLDRFIDRYLGDAALPARPWNGGRLWRLRECVFNPEHTSGSAAIIEMASGAIVYRCFHNGCQGRSWSDVRARFEPIPIRERMPAAQAPTRDAWAPAEPPPPDEASEGDGGPEYRRFALTDLGNAERLVAQHGHDIRFNGKWKKWMVYDGTRWVIDSSQEVMRRAALTVRSIYKEAGGASTQEEREAIGKHALRSENEARIRAMVKLAEPKVPIEPEELDQDGFLFNCANGTLNLRTGELQPHRRDDFITKKSPVAFDPEASAPLWGAFLDRVLDKNRRLIAFVQRMCGYTMTADTGEQVMFFLHGGGRNGKSVLIRTVEYVLDDYAKPTRPETLMAKNKGEIPNEIADLAGARFVPTVEVEDGRRLAESLVKQLTGGDTIKARFLYGDLFSFHPTFKIWLAANHRPIVRGTDIAIWERIRLVPFTVTIPEHERDPKLADKLRDEGPGILRWMLEGCRAWQHEGLKPPPEVMQATESYRADMDVLGQFLEECCEKDKAARTYFDALFNAYKEWCVRSGEHAVSHRRFGDAMKERGFGKERAPAAHRRLVYVGLRLLPTGDVGGVEESGYTYQELFHEEEIGERSGNGGPNPSNAPDSGHGEGREYSI